MRLTIQLDNKHFPLPLDARWIDGKMWELLSDFKYVNDKGEEYTARKGLITDFGSKPWWCWWLVGSPTDEGGPAYIIHDQLCQDKPFPYSKIDRIFYKALRDANVTYLKRTLMYSAVCTWHLFL